MFRLQMFAEAVAGTKIVYLYRILSKEATTSARGLAFTTENGRTNQKLKTRFQQKKVQSVYRERQNQNSQQLLF